MVFVGVRAQGGQDRGVHIANLSREQSRVAEVHQRLVTVVPQELLDVIGQAHAVVQRLGVLHFVVVQLVEQVVRVVLQIQTLGIAQLGDALLVLVADVVAWTASSRMIRRITSAVFVSLACAEKYDTAE